MFVDLKYGRSGLRVRVPDDATVILPRELAGLPDEPAALRNALAQPIGAAPLVDALRPADRVSIVFSDITRPMPSDRVLPVLLEEIARVVPPEQVVLINATGTHMANTRDELIGMLGRDVVERYRIVNHDAWDTENLVDLGRTPQGHRVLVNRLFYEADYRILTGFIEPHIFAGFSGGPKAVLPGVAGIESIMDNHGYAMLGDPRATWGVVEGNPVWEEMRAFARIVRPSFSVNVTLNRLGQITGVYAGDMERAHAEGVSLVRSHAMVPVDGQYEVVLTTNSGYPLDINLYQTIKGLSAAMQVVRPGGSIIIASECRGGIPDYGEYRRLVVEGASPEGILEMIAAPGFRCHDQWEAQLHAQIMQAASVYVYSDGLADEQIREMLFEPTHDIEATIARELERHGPETRLLVMPEGPQSIPYIRA
ncbi:MAG: nickel-dependent lactate racemase [Chloroflexi bacterium]|nr:nickel-dependent lactate racemase [Chloroflexota bacterium]